MTFSNLSKVDFFLLLLHSVPLFSIYYYIIILIAQFHSCKATAKKKNKKKEISFSFAFKFNYNYYYTFYNFFYFFLILFFSIRTSLNLYAKTQKLVANVCFIAVVLKMPILLGLLLYVYFIILGWIWIFVIFTFGFWFLLLFITWPIVIFAHRCRVLMPAKCHL